MNWIDAERYIGDMCNDIVKTYPVKCKVEKSLIKYRGISIEMTRGNSIKTVVILSSHFNKSIIRKTLLDMVRELLV